MYSNLRLVGVPYNVWCTNFICHMIWQALFLCQRDLRGCKYYQLISLVCSNKLTISVIDIVKYGTFECRTLKPATVLCHSLFYHVHMYTFSFCSTLLFISLFHDTWNVDCKVLLRINISGSNKRERELLFDSVVIQTP